MAEDQSQQTKAQHIDDAQFKSLLESTTDKPFMVDFYADWCGPCRVAAPVIDKLAGEYGDKAVIAKLDVDANNTAAQYGIMSIPTVIVFKNGQEVVRQVGFPGEDGYRQMIEKAMN